MLRFVSEKKERLDKFMAEASGRSRSLAQKSIKKGDVAVGGKIVTEPDFNLRKGDVVEFPEMEKKELVGSLRQLDVIFENDDLAVIDKPAGLVVHPGAGNDEDTLSHALISLWPKTAKVGEPHRPGIVHRLDEDTSGLIVVAKTNKALEYLKELFLEKKVEKHYLALVHGTPEKLHGIIDLPLSKNFKRRKMSVGEGKPAVTEYSVLAEGRLPSSLDQIALLKVKLHTGRTHQIRAHLSHINHPVVGDKVYGGSHKKFDIKALNRQFLHSSRLMFRLPDGTWGDFRSDLPKELTQILIQSGINYEDNSI
jgi:23S rRNA pseudouridine1911/1915/1917 synthase